MACLLPVVLTAGLHLAESIPAGDLHQVLNRWASYSLPESRSHPEDAEDSRTDPPVPTLTVVLLPPIGALGAEAIRATNSRVA